MKRLCVGCYTAMVARWEALLTFLERGMPLREWKDGAWQTTTTKSRPLSEGL